MQLTNGINHVAIVTPDLDRFIDFYSDVFGAEVVWSDRDPNFCHALLSVGPDAFLHPIEQRDSAHARGLPDMFGRGHLDHLGINATSMEALQEIRRRLVARGACDGSMTDFGPALSVWFADPDGLEGEACFVLDPTLRGMHGPERIPA